MTRRRRRDTEVFSLSFLDAISGGFGAIVMLLVIVKVAEPGAIRDRGTGLAHMATELSSQLPPLDQRLLGLQQQLAQAQAELAQRQRQVAQLAPQAAAASAARAEAVLNARAQSTIEQRLASARQQLTAEMLRLQAVRPRPLDPAIGGIPVDSEYIIFIIDTSGSMQLAWPKVIRTLDEVLNAYPKVKGIQVLSDMGEYLYSQYAGQWIPDTPGRRTAILQRMSRWQTFSNSSPVEGILAAIQTFHDPDKRISIFVFGDDFTGTSIQSVLDTVSTINPRGADGRPLVRIHGIGFPVMFAVPGAPPAGGLRFAALMRSLSSANGGTFTTLNDIR